MAKPKYVAEGFEEDVTKLLADFVKECSVEFIDYARIWREHNFSLVFMGRPTPTELSEFTNEIFRITSAVLFSPLFYQRIGAVYTLYALYRNQIARPPIKIRIELRHWRKIKELLTEGISKKYKSLLYVIDYLRNNAFHFVAHQTLKGPLTRPLQNEIEDPEIVAMKYFYKVDLTEYSANNNLQALKDLSSQYLEIKKKLPDITNLNVYTDVEVYQDFINEASRLVNPPVTKDKIPENIKDRRAKIKAQAFSSKAKDRYGQMDDEDIDNPNYTKLSPVKKNNETRSAKKWGKLGRPPKKVIPDDREEPKSDDDNIDITHLLEQQKELYLPPTDKKMRSQRHYYTRSPKRKDTEKED